MTDYAVHRLRFGDITPSPIKAIAADPFSAMVAIGREDGDIEISDSAGKWYTLARVPGHNQFSLQALAWSAIQGEHGRLFGISLRGFIFEVDLATLTYKNIGDSYGGSAFCLSACTRKPLLVVGSEDGAARLFSYENDSLDYVKSLPTIGVRILSIGFHPSMPRIFMGCSDGTIRCVEEDTGRSVFRMTGDLQRGLATHIWSLVVMSDSTVVTGDNRGHVQLWDGNTGVLMVSLHQHTADVLCLAVSPDESSIFASGVDSRVTCIRRFAVVPRSRAGLGIPNDATQEVDSVPVLGEGTSADGINSSPSPSDWQWVYHSSHRPHSLDVHALAVCRYAVNLRADRDRGHGNANSPRDSDAESSRYEAPSSSSAIGAPTSMLVSGGLDCKLCVYCIDDFTRTRPALVLPLPASGLVQASASHNLIALRHRRHIDVWEVQLARPPALPTNQTEGGSTDANSERGKKQKRSRDADATKGKQASDTHVQEGSAALSADERCHVALRLELRNPAHLHCFTISSDGLCLAASSSSGTYLWELRRTEVEKMCVPSSSSSSLSAVKVILPQSVQGFSHALAFDPAGRRLAMATSSGRIVLLEMKEVKGRTTAKKAIRNKKEKVKDSRSIGDKGKSKRRRAGKKGNDGGDDDDDEEGVDEDYDDENEDIGEDSEDDARSSMVQGPSISTSVWHSLDHQAHVLEKQSRQSRKSQGSTASVGLESALQRAVSSLAFSADGVYLAVADAGSCVYVYDLDALRLHWALPKAPLPVTAIAFAPSSMSASSSGARMGGSVLVLVLNDNSVLRFDIESLEHIPLPRRDGDDAVTETVPAAIRNWPAPMEGVIFGQISSPNMLLYGQNQLTFVNPSQPPPSKVNIVTPIVLNPSANPAEDGALEFPSLGSGSSHESLSASKKRRKKEKHARGGEGRNFSLVSAYHSIVHVGVVDADEVQTSDVGKRVSKTTLMPQLVIVENPWVRILAQLPDPIARKRYGT